MQLYGWSNVEAGQVCNLFWLGLALGSPTVGWYSAKIKQRCRPLLFCFACGLIASLFIVFAKGLPHYIIGIALFLLGFSASVQSLSFGLIKDIVPSEMFGMASGLNNMAAILGGGIAQPLVGFLLQLKWQGHTINHTPVYAINDYQTAFILLPLAAIIGILVTRFKIKETSCQKQY